MRRTLWAGVLALGMGMSLNAADPRETTPMPRPADKNAVVKPFDLQYLPLGGHVVAGIRPAVVAKKAGSRELCLASSRMLAALVAFVGGQPDVDDLPAVTDIEQILIRYSGKLVVPNDESTINTGHEFDQDTESGLVVTSRQPFDWSAVIKKWFPKAKAVTLEGRTTYTVSSGFGHDVAVWVPTPTTLVVTWNEKHMRALQDRVSTGVPPAAVIGWVDDLKAAMLIVVDNANHQAITFPPKPKETKTKLLRQANTLVRTMTIIWSGASKDDLRCVLETPTEASAQRLEKLLPRLAKAVSENAANTWGKTVSRTGTVVSVVGTMPVEADTERTSINR